MKLLDYIVFLGYLAGVMGVGAWARSKEKREGDYFLAGRSLGRWPIGLSVMVTAFSAINFIAFPSEVFQHGLYVLASLPAFLLVAWPISRFFIPFFHRQTSSSGYAFLETVYDYKVRALTSGLFLIWRVIWMSTALYASGKILSAVTGWNVFVILTLCGITATLYTSLGGFRAVVYTDVVQFFVLLGGIILATVLTLRALPGGLTDVINHVAEGGRFNPVCPVDKSFFSFDPRIRITLWSALSGTVVAFLARYGADQMVIQRYMASKSLAEAKAGFRLNIIAAVLCISTLAVFGLGIYAFARENGHETLPPIKNIALLFQTFPTGLAGAVGAALLAATMSSVDSGINACCMTVRMDFSPHAEAKKRSTENGRGNIFLSLGIGLTVTGAAAAIHWLDQDIFQLVNRVVHGFGSPILGIVFSGMFLSRWTTSRGVFTGGLLGAIVSVGVIAGVQSLSLHYYAVVNVGVTVALCVFFSRLPGFSCVPNPPEIPRQTE